MRGLRLATPRDIPTLVAMAVRFLREQPYRDQVSIDREHIELQLLPRVMTEGVMFVADADGHPVGMAGYLIVPSPLTGELVCSELCWWLEPGYRGGRLGAALWFAGEQWGRVHGATYIHMIAPAGSELVRRMYRRRGYVELESTFQKRIAA